MSSYMERFYTLSLPKQLAIQRLIKYQEDEETICTNILKKIQTDNLQEIGSQALLQLSNPNDDNSRVRRPPPDEKKYSFTNTKKRTQTTKNPNKLFWEKLQKVAPSQLSQVEIRERLKNPLKTTNKREMSPQARENRFTPLTMKIIIEKETFEINRNNLKGHFKRPTPKRKDHANLYAKGSIYGKSITIKAYVANPKQWLPGPRKTYEIDIKIGNLFFSLDGSIGRTKEETTQTNIGYLNVKNTKLSIRIEEYCKKRKRDSTSDEDFSIKKPKRKKRKC